MAISWQEDLRTRLRALIRTSPLHRLEASKVQRAEELSRHDLRALSLRAIDRIIEAMGLGSGASREQVQESLRELVQAADPSATREDGERITAIVLDGLLNETDRRQAFREPYAAPDEDGTRWRELAFQLVREEEQADGSIVLRATTDGINVYTGMLAVAVEDAQAADEAVLRSQIRRGRIAEAVATARRARVRSIEYEQKLMAILQSMRRDVARVDWVNDVLRMLGEARDHLDERLQVEQELLEQVERRLDGTTKPEESGLLSQLAAALRDCRTRHLALQSRLIPANQQFLDEQARQAFRPRIVTPLPELEADVLREALRTPVGPMAAVADSLLRAFHAPRVPRPLYVPALIDRLLSPRRPRDQEDLAPPSPDLVEVEGDAVRFSDADHARIDGLLKSDSPQRLSSMLGELRRDATTPALEQLLVLRVLEAWDVGEDTWAIDVARDGSTLDDPAWAGDDLAIRPRLRVAP